MNKPQLYEASLKFYQDGNTLGTTSETEEITVTVEGDDLEGKSFFYTLRTTTGWSIDDPNELVDLVNRVKSIVLNK